MAAPDVPPPPHEHAERPVWVHLTPHAVEPSVLAGGIVIMIDNLRASTTIAAALSRGALWIAPCLTVDDARARKQAAEALPGAQHILLGGERGGRRIEGFDLDNSPAAYVESRVRGHGICFTTTNGSAALIHASAADEVLVGCVANADAVCAEVRSDPRPVHILCAGTREEVSLDDCLAAGLIVHRLLESGRGTMGEDSAILCHEAYLGAVASGPEGLLRAMKRSRGGRNLIRLGLESDVEACSSPDWLTIVPSYDARTGLIAAT